VFSNTYVWRARLYIIKNADRMIRARQIDVYRGLLLMQKEIYSDYLIGLSSTA